MRVVDYQTEREDSVQAREETPLQPPDHTPDSRRSEDREDNRLVRTLLWIGVAGLTAGLAFGVAKVFALSRRPPDDPTSQRIQQLIDEANSLLKTLDEQRNSA